VRARSQGCSRTAIRGNTFPIAPNPRLAGFDQPLLCGMYVDRRLAGITDDIIVNGLK
jgi:hypothetical protein